MNLTKEELWKIYVDKNPLFDDPEARVVLTGRGIKKLFEQTYDCGHDKGVANGRALEQMEREKEQKTKPNSTSEDSSVDVETELTIDLLRKCSTEKIRTYLTLLNQHRRRGVLAAEVFLGMLEDLATNCQLDPLPDQLLNPQQNRCPRCGLHLCTTQNPQSTSNSSAPAASDDAS